MFQRSLLLSTLLTGLLFAAATDKLSTAEKIRLQNRNVVKMAAEGLSQKLPQRVDRYTQLVKITPEGERLIYTFEIDDPKLHDEEVVKKGEERMRTPVIRGICTSAKRFLQSGIEITYLYREAGSKKRLFRFDVKQSDCEAYRGFPGR